MGNGGIWIGIAILLVVAFAYKMFTKLRRMKRTRFRLPEIKTRKKRKLFAQRFKHLEGCGD